VKSLAVLVILVCLPALAAAAELPVPDRVRPAVADVQRAPSADRVRLTDGFLGQRLAIDEKNLVNADEDWMLAGFRHRPGEQAWVGEHVGKFLHAATLAWASSGDPALRRKIDRVAAALIGTQEPDGYLGTYVPAKRFTLAKDNDWDVWVHKYDLIGLLTYYQYTGNADALAACRKVGDLLCRTFGKDRKNILSAGTHVGMAATSVLEPMVRLYDLTGDRKYLDFCLYLTEAMESPGGPKLLSTLATVGRVDRTANGKAYEMLSNLNGLCELYRVTGNRRFLAPVLAAWKDVTARRLYLTGTSSFGEHFQGDHQLPNEGPVGETCVTVTWMQVNLQLLRLTGEARYAEEIERSAYNHLAAAQRTEAYGWCYFTELAGPRSYGSRTCCASSGPRGLALMPTCAFATDDAGLVVNLYESGHARLTRPDGSAVALDVRSLYPAEGRADLTLHPERPGRFAVKLRIPAWCRGARVVVNGQPAEAAAPPGHYASVEADWKDGDTIRLELPLALRVLVDRAADPGKAALAYGPLVLATDETLAGQPLPGGRDAGKQNLVLTWTDPRELGLKTFPVTGRPTWTKGGRFYEITAHHGTPDHVGEAFRLRLLPFAEAGSFPWFPDKGHARILVWFNTAPGAGAEK
jgi:DUF1680 family protein